MNRTINIDIIHKIAEYIRPEPGTYCRLALVSRDFYRVFTSDTAWQYLNPYGLDRGIIMDFWKKCSEADLDYIREIHRSGVKLIQPSTHNLYCWLAFYSHSNWVEGNWARYADRHELEQNLTKLNIKNRQLLWCLVNIDGRLFYTAANNLRSDRECCLAAVRTYLHAFMYASPDLYHDAEIVQVAILYAGADYGG